MVKRSQTIRRLSPTNCLSVLDHFVGLKFKGSSCRICCWHYNSWVLLSNLVSHFLLASEKLATYMLNLVYDKSCAFSKVGSGFCSIISMEKMCTPTFNWLWPEYIFSKRVILHLSCGLVKKSSLDHSEFRISCVWFTIAAPWFIVLFNKEPSST